MKKDGQLLHEFRKGNKLTLSEIAKLTDVSVSTVSNYERGKAFMTDVFKSKLNTLFGVEFGETKSKNLYVETPIEDSIVEIPITVEVKSESKSDSKKRGRFPTKKILQGLGNAVKSHRAQSGLTTDEYASKFKAKKSYILDVETGRREVKTIPVNYLAKLVRDGVDINTFFSGE